MLIQFVSFPSSSRFSEKPASHFHSSNSKLYALKQYRANTMAAVANFVKRNLHAMDFNGWSVVAIRAVGLLLLIGLATLELHPLVDEYLNHNFGTQITIMGNDEKTAMRPPAVTLCVPWSGSHYLEKIAEHLDKTSRNQTSSRCDQCELLAAHGWDVWTSVDLSNATCVHDYRLAITEEMMKKLFDDDRDDADRQNRSMKALNISEYKWHRPVIDAVWDFVDCVQQLDLNAGLPKKTANNGDGSSSCGDRPSWCFQNRTADLFLSNPKKIDRLFDSIIDIICEYIEFRDENYTLYAKNICVSTLERTSSIVYGDQFCFALPDKDRFGSVITSKTQSKYGARAALNATTYSRLFVFSDSDLVSFGAGNMENGYPIYVSDGLEDVIRLGYVITATLVERRSGVPCYRERSPAVCRSKCMLRRIVSVCGCVPFTFSSSISESIPSGTPYCTSEAYESCGLDKPKEMTECEHKCTYPCEYTSYQWIVNRQQQGGQNGGGTLMNSRRYSTTRQSMRHIDLQLYPISTTFMEFAVTVKNTPAQFLSQVAGVLSLYLGFSGLTLIAVVIFLGSAIKKWRATVANNKNDMAAKFGERAPGNGLDSGGRDPSAPIALIYGNPESRGGGSAVELISYQSLQEMRMVLERLKFLEANEGERNGTAHGTANKPLELPPSKHM